jgi:hypothetical protein
LREIRPVSDTPSKEIPMKKTLTRAMFSFLTTATLGATLLATPAFAEDHTYQVTGPVLEVTDTSITVQKGKEKWTIARDKGTKVTGDLKVGAKVTIMYSMSAASIEVKGGAKGDAKADAKGEAKAEAKGEAKADAKAKK